MTLLTQTGLSIKGDLWARGTENARAWLPSRYHPRPQTSRQTPRSLPPLAWALSGGSSSSAPRPPSGATSRSQLRGDSPHLATPPGRPRAAGSPRVLTEVLGRTLIGPAGVPGLPLTNHRGQASGICSLARPGSHDPHLRRPRLGKPVPRAGSWEGVVLQRVIKANSPGESNRCLLQR